MNKDHKAVDNSIVFNKDVGSSGSYIYTKKEILSARLSHERISKEMVDMVKEHFPRKIKILDIGCGDGTYTIELFNFLKPTKILGFDPASKAIKYANSRIVNNQKNQIAFQIGNIYKIENVLKKDKYDLAIIRAVFHHLDHPELAVNRVCKYFDKVVILEPNGYSPILKIFEKTSKYHRRHFEKSYFPFLIDKWFLKNDYILVDRKIFNIIPCFSKNYLAQFLKKAGPFFEGIPLIRNFYCSSNVSFYQKRTTIRS
jgi:ubiquinone/menaquinone biosynthesis C-methylase UbiE